MRKIVLVVCILVVFCVVAFAAFVCFFDEAVLVRKGTLYRVSEAKKLVALTFDDGPSPVWTPQILEELKKAGIKATFFMVGEQVLKYPDVARRVADEGHEIGNHSFDHHVLLYYTPQEVEAEIRKAEEAIFKATGKTTRYFRPPKAWLTDDEKKKIGLMGYGVVLWSLNSKDWVGFDDKVIVRYISGNVRPGDIILFHDSGGALAVEGGDRHQTVQSVSRLERTLRQKGYSFVTVSELLAARQKP